MIVPGGGWSGSSTGWKWYPWRAANNINNTDFPEPPPYAGDKRIFQAELFYDVNHPVRRKLHEGYDPTDRRAAMNHVQRLQEQGEIPTGLLYIDPKASDLHAALKTVAQPLNRMGEADLCPGPAVLEKINAGLR